LSDIPLARKEKAGKSIAHHHFVPLATLVNKSAAEMNMNPKPKMMFLMESATVRPGRSFASLASPACCKTRPRLPAGRRSARPKLRRGRRRSFGKIFRHRGSRFHI
jgi:hypothetical protein